MCIRDSRLVERFKPSFIVLICTRKKEYCLIKTLVERFDEAILLLASADENDKARLEALYKSMLNAERKPFFGHRARLSQFHQLRPTGPGAFEVIQTVLAADEDHGYALQFSVKLAPNLGPDTPILTLDDILEP